MRADFGNMRMCMQMNGIGATYFIVIDYYAVGKMRMQILYNKIDGIISVIQWVWMCVDDKRLKKRFKILENEYLYKTYSKTTKMQLL